MQMHTIPQYEALFARYPLDFVILSIHQVGDKEFWTQDFQKGKTQKEYNEQYYLVILGKPAAELTLAWNLASTSINAVTSAIASVAVYMALRPVTNNTMKNC